ncbi:helix-turn-helix domain-containing protein [Streptomyces sp. HPF1205]|uniref:helix-turn-helix domain-containing protein n=1 Tax=Streptomyces sp. HPF1205 TaxID=2873262 RepID=UPI001CED91E4|nr:helix-turn-helix domain-containing protein [Streptomyces sp. HPF1205]
MADPQSNANVPAQQLPEGAPSSGVIHVRHRHRDRFTIVGNHLAQHPRLSAVAIGLAVHILSLPDGASVTVKALTLRFREGETTIRRAMNELEEAGYVVRRRVPLGRGRFATRTFAYDRPGYAPDDDRRHRAGREPQRPSPRPEVPGARQPVAAPSPGPPPASPPRPSPGPSRGGPSLPAPSGPAADLLARLRLADPRLLLSARDIAQLLPAVDTWLARAATPVQIARTLTAGLPPEPVPIHHPARLLAHRLTVLLPPPLPAEAGPAERPAPLHTCDGCDRAIRTHDPHALCADCRRVAAAA